MKQNDGLGVLTYYVKFLCVSPTMQGIEPLTSGVT